MYLHLRGGDQRGLKALIRGEGQIVELHNYTVNSDNKPWAYIVSKFKVFLVVLFLGELIFGGAYYWKEFCVSKWVGLDSKNSSNH